MSKIKRHVIGLLLAFGPLGIVIVAGMRFWGNVPIIQGVKLVAVAYLLAGIAAACGILGGRYAFRE